MGFFTKSSGKTRILVVDDSPLIVMSIKLILEDAGYEVLDAFDGVAALKLAEDMIPKVILLDLMMPGMDGIEALSRLKTNTKTAAIPVLMVTGSQTGKDVEKAFGYGASGYVVKPVEADRLLAKITAALAPK
jgi:two-component system alkaline phosphatase synthesis response regulator PhoP